MSAASYQRVQGANDRIQVGFIGCGRIARRHLSDFKNEKDVDMAAMSDVHQARAEECVAQYEPRARAFQDFRRVLEMKDIQAVVVSTSDHWHALASIMACAAGKDVYVEKPMTTFVAEGRWMVQAARRYKRVVQVGTQQRSGPHYQKAVREILQGGYIGKILSTRVGSYRNVMPGWGNPPDSPPPPGLDWDLWLGPAPKRPYNRNRCMYTFRWFWDYSGGQMTNLGVHEMDVVLWVLKAKGPTAVSSSGGRFGFYNDNTETPDTQDALFEFSGGSTALFTYREASSGPPRTVQFFGTKGNLEITREYYRVTPDNLLPPGGAYLQEFPAAPAPAGGAPTGAGNPWIPLGSRWRVAPPPKPKPSVAPLEMAGSADEEFVLHTRNFLDCIKTRKRPNADVEDGHQAATACHLANISLRTGRKLRWDAETEEIIGDREASGYLVRQYREPWGEVLRSLKLGE